MLMNLVFAETIIAVYGIPVDFTASLLHGWKMGKIVCYVTGFLLTFSGKFYQRIHWQVDKVVVSLIQDFNCITPIRCHFIQ